MQKSMQAEETEDNHKEAEALAQVLIGSKKKEETIRTIAVGLSVIEQLLSL